MTRRRPPATPDLAAARATVAAHLDVLLALLLDRDGVADLAADLGRLAVRAGCVRPPVTRHRTERHDLAPGRLHVPSPAGALALARRELPDAMAALGFAGADSDPRGGAVALVDAVARACGVSDAEVAAAPCGLTARVYAATHRPAVPT